MNEEVHSPLRAKPPSKPMQKPPRHEPRKAASGIFANVLAFDQQRRLKLLIAAAVFFSCGYFFQGGGWNQNAFFATTVALVETGSPVLDDYRQSTGDLARAGDHVVSAKAIATSLVAVPGYLVARTLTLPIENPGDRTIIRAYITTLLTSGLGLTFLAWLLFSVCRRRLDPAYSAGLTFAACLTTPLWPNSTMLTSHPLACLSALGAYALLEYPRLRQELPSPSTLFFAGLAAGGAAAFEYMLAVLILPLGIYAACQCRQKPWWFIWWASGVAATLAIPLAHHTLVFGDPLQTGYSTLVNRTFSRHAQQGFMGFVGFDLAVLFELTFGQIRGFFFLSPWLIAVLPAIIRMLKNRTSRPEGLACGSMAIGVLLLVSSLVYWHSGSAVGCRYALVFIVFSVIPITLLANSYRGWIVIGAGFGFAFMTMATSVTAIPPPPGRYPYENVIRWLWERFSRGELATWQQPILEHQGAVKPTLPFAFNLGQLMGLPGLWSLLPWLLILTILSVLAFRAAHACRAG